MDALVGLLDGPRARGAFLLRCLLDPPWAMRIEDEAPLTLVTMVRGHAWIVPDGADPVRIEPGDVAIARGPDHYVVADEPSTPPQVVIHPGQRCTTLDGQELYQAMDLGVRTWGNSPDGATVMLTGTYTMDGEVSGRLLAVLPTLAVVPGDEVDSSLIQLLGAEITREQPGQKAILDRVLDLLLVSVLRAWLARPEADAPAWFVAHSDPVVGPALRMLHNNPSHSWTVGNLASEVGTSRAAFARRFTDLVGEPPMTYLTGWRLTLAADLLREPDATVGSVARQVGYSTPYALSTAFKRAHGMSPREYRAAADHN